MGNKRAQRRGSRRADRAMTINIGTIAGNKGRVFPQVTVEESGFTHDKSIILPAQSVTPTPLTSYVAYIAITDNDLRTTANGGNVTNANGYDIVFFDEALQLDFELESYNASTGEVRAWVRIPNWDPSTNKIIDIYYGDTEITTSQENVGGVWQNELAVIDETGADLTGNGNTFTPTNVSATTLLGGAGDYNGSTSVMVRNDADWLNGISGLTVRTVCTADAVANDKGIFMVGTTFAQDDANDIVLRGDQSGFSGGGSQVFLWNLQSPSNNRYETASSRYVTGTTMAIAGRWDGTNGNDFFYNGDKDIATFDDPGDESTFTPVTDTCYIGAASKDSAAGGWDGKIGRVMFRSSAMNDTHLQTETANWYHGEDFIGLSSENLAADTVRAPAPAPRRSSVPNNSFIDLDLLAKAADPNSLTLTISAVGTPSSGTLALQTGSIYRYTPQASFTGTATFTYTVSNGTKTSTETVTVTVTEPPPTDAGGVRPAQHQDAQWGGLYSGYIANAYRLAPIKVGGNGTDCYRPYDEDQMAIRFIAPRTGSVPYFWLRMRAGDPNNSGDRCGCSSSPSSWAANYNGNLCQVGGEYNVDDGGPLRVEIYEHAGTNWESLSLGPKIAETNIATDVVTEWFNTGQAYRFTFSPALELVNGAVYVALVTPTQSTKKFVTFNQNTGRNAAPITDTLRAGPYAQNIESVWMRRRGLSSPTAWTSDSDGFGYAPATNPLWGSYLLEYSGQTYQFYGHCGLWSRLNYGSQTNTTRVFVSAATQLEVTITPEIQEPWTNFWVQAHKQSGAGDLNINIYKNGAFLQTIVLPASSFATESVAGDALGAPYSWKWVQASLSSQQTYTLGTTYRFEIFPISGTYRFYSHDPARYLFDVNKYAGYATNANDCRDAPRSVMNWTIGGNDVTSTASIGLAIEHDY